MIRVLVAVPAHDEEDEIEQCLRSLVRAARSAVDAGACEAVTIGVGLNRCVDRTAQLVEDVVRSTGHPILVAPDPLSRTVGAVRARLVNRLSVDHRADPSDTWLFNTDADTRVPEDWIVHTLLDHVTSRVRAVAGMVRLREWKPSAQALSAYRALIEAGISGGTHSHVYGANLAVRLDAYERVGGFRAVASEDQDLVDRLRLAGEHVATSMTSYVDTSARQPGRASAGLGALLERLHLDPGAVPGPTAGPAG